MICNILTEQVLTGAAVWFVTFWQDRIIQVQEYDLQHFDVTRSYRYSSMICSILTGQVRTVAAVWYATFGQDGFIQLQLYDMQHFDNRFIQMQQYDLQHFDNSGRNYGDNLKSVWECFVYSVGWGSVCNDDMLLLNCELCM